MRMTGHGSLPPILVGEIGLSGLETAFGKGRVASDRTNGLPTLAKNLRSNFTREQYLEAVNRVKRYIVAGDIYQANISQRFEATVDADTWALYQALRRTAPAPLRGLPRISGLRRLERVSRNSSCVSKMESWRLDR